MFLDNNSATGSHRARRHGPGWRTAHARFIDDKTLILKQLPFRFVRVLLVGLRNGLNLLHHNDCHVAWLMDIDCFMKLIP